MIVANYEEDCLKKYKPGFISAYNELNSMNIDNEIEAFHSFININRKYRNFDNLDMKKSISMHNDIMRINAVLNRIKIERVSRNEDFILNKNFRELIKSFFNKYKK